MRETTRRTVLTGAASVTAAAVLAACGDDAEPGTDTGTQPTGGAAPTAAGGTSTGTGNALATKSDIPVGGGKIFAKEGVVITQPAAGQFKGFTSECTHQGCPVTSVEGGTINCSCHGSKFSATDGSVKNGPATRPLAAKNLKIDGDNITLA